MPRTAPLGIPLLTHIIGFPIYLAEWLVAMFTVRFVRQGTRGNVFLARKYENQVALWQNRHGTFHCTHFAPYYNDKSAADVRCVMKAPHSETNVVNLNRVVIMGASTRMQERIRALLQKAKESPQPRQPLQSHDKLTGTITLLPSNQIEWIIPEQDVPFFPTLLRFHYTAACHFVTPQNVLLYLRIAHTYAMPVFLRHLRCFLWNNMLQVDRVELLYECIRLKEHALYHRLTHFLTAQDFPSIFEHFIFTLNAWDQFVKLLDSDVLAFTDDELFEKIEWYCDVNAVSTEMHRKMLECVRIPLLNRENLTLKLPILMAKNPRLVEKDRLTAALEYRASMPKSLHAFLKQWKRRTSSSSPNALHLQPEQYTQRPARFYIAEKFQNEVVLLNNRRTVQSIALGSAEVVVPIPEGALLHRIRLHVVSTTGTRIHFNSYMSPEVISVHLGVINPNSGQQCYSVMSSALRGPEGVAFRFEHNDVVSLELDQREEVVRMYSRFGVLQGETIVYAPVGTEIGLQRYWFVHLNSDTVHVTLLD